MKNLAKIGGKGMIVLAATAILVATLFGACNKNAQRATVKFQQNDTIYGDHAWAVMSVVVDTVHFHAEHESGEVIEMNFILPSYTKILPHDTNIGHSPVAYYGRVHSTTDTSAEYAFGECFRLRTVVTKARDAFEFGTDNGSDTTSHYLEHMTTVGYADAWGMVIPIPVPAASITYKDLSTEELGGDGTWDYTRVTCRYTVKQYGAEYVKEGYKTLKRAAGSHEFTGKELLSAVWSPVAYNSFGFVTRAKVDVKIASHYNGLPDQVDEESIERDCPIIIPGDSTKYAQNFDFSHAAPVIGQEYVTGTATEGHFHVTDKAVNYYVGTSIFTRVPSFGWFELTWSDGTYTFPIETPSYGNFSEQYSVNDLPAQNGYDRKKVTNTVYASINNITAHAPINTFVLVESQTPPPPQEVDTTYQVVTSGLTYVNQTTNTSWIKLRPVYSDGTSGTPFNKDITLENTVTCPQEGPFYTDNFNNVGVVGQVTMGTPELLEEYSSGEFLKRKYRQTAEINLGVFSLTWVLTYEKAIYTPLNYEMPYATYSCFVSSGSYTDDLGEITSQNETWLRKIWTQYMTTSFNQHNHQYAGTAEVRAPNTIPRITPEWLGNPLEAIYTRVQAGVGQQFQDMIVFRYEHGVVMAPNGVPDLNLIYAFTAADAAAHGVDQVYTPAAWYSGVFFSGHWWPAAITPNSGYTAWTYSYDGTPAHSHTVQRANALILNIGYDYHPIPSHQYYTISNGVITICYNANNQGESVTAQCQLH